MTNHLLLNKARPKRITILNGSLLTRVLLLLAIGSGLFQSKISRTAWGEEYAIGADVSFLADAERKGVVFKENSQPKPGLQILKDHGYNWVRLRLFHTPKRLPNDLAYTVEQARAAKKLGFKFLLDLHYSDTWADPQKQFIPQAWDGFNHDQLVESVFTYTRDVVAAFRQAGVAPDMVQIGNEVIGGMLWPDGRLPNNWANFADLLKAGIRGVKAGAAEEISPRIMIHIDRGGDQKATKAFFDRCREFNVEYDVIGQSYYPWWHGSLDDLRKNMAFMARTYDKDIYLVEVAYNWRPTEYQDTAPPFPETPQGQQSFLRDVDNIVHSTPNGRGRGIFWWEPAVPPGPLASRGMFDPAGNALPVINVFDALAPADNAGSGVD
jgi:arabinogalactan endo-1,4-beta-galactosidase